MNEQIIDNTSAGVTEVVDGAYIERIKVQEDTKYIYPNQV